MGLFFLCPYSAEPFTFGLATSGIPGTIITFCRGDCSNHEEWTRADLGIKNDQTFIEKQTLEYLIKNLASARSNSSINNKIHRYVNHIYYAEEE